MHTRTSILSSLPDSSVERRISGIKSKVSEALLVGRTEVEKILLNQSDISLQQNEVLARAADEISVTLEEVKYQTTKTNGTVKEHENFISDYKKSAAKRTKLMVTLVPVFVVVLEIAAKYFGLL